MAECTPVARAAVLQLQHRLDPAGVAVARKHRDGVLERPVGYLPALTHGEEREHPTGSAAEVPQPSPRPKNLPADYQTPIYEPIIPSHERPSPTTRGKTPERLAVS